MKSRDRFESLKLSQLTPQHGQRESIESPHQHRGGHAGTLTLFCRGTGPFLNTILASLEVPKFDQKRSDLLAYSKPWCLLRALLAPGFDPAGDLWRVVLHKCLSTVKDQRKREGNICLAFPSRCQEDVSPGSTPEETGLLLSGELFNTWDHLVHSKTLISWASLATPLPLKRSWGLFK